jgi:NAD(P)-dependent dehydrogenase (short-subunit alcohol dehydrogenase family)
MDALDRFRLDGKVALLTGGCGILGRRFAHGLAAAGAHVVVVDVDEAAVQGLAAELPTLSIGLACDVTDAAAVERCVQTAMDRFGRIDVLHNNAASKSRDQGAFFAPFEEYSLATWREVMAVNIDGMFLVAQAAGKRMAAAGRGSIIQTSSIYGLVGPDNRIYEGSHYLGGPINTPAVYAASKAAVIGLTRWLATYWAERGVRANCLVPGGVSSGQNSTFSERYSQRVPMGRMAEADELVPALLYLASDASSYVNGQVLAVDGGWTAW